MDSAGKIIAYHVKIVAYRIKIVAYHIKIAVYHVKIVAYHVKIVAYHVKIVAYRIKIVVYHVKIVAYRVKIVVYHVKIVAYHVKIVAYHIKIVVYHIKIAVYHVKIVAYHVKIVLYHVKIVVCGKIEVQSKTTIKFKEGAVMYYKTSEQIDRLLVSARVAIEGALNEPVILAALTQYGYDEARLQEGLALCQETEELVRLQQAEYGEQYQATAELNRAWDEASTLYTATLEIARIALRGNYDAAKALDLHGRRKRSFSGWFEQAVRFYRNLLDHEDWLTAMGRYGYTRERLEGELAQVEALLELERRQEDEKGDAQRATKLRDAKVDELSQWLADYKAVARIALRDDPQQLEKLGFGAVA